MTESVRLKNCPCCNTAGVAFARGMSIGKSHTIKCVFCGLETKRCSTPEEAASLWNRRPTPSNEAVEQAKMIVDWVELSGEGPPDAWPTTCGSAVTVARALLSVTERSDMMAPRGFYVASRASLPERPAMWRRLRDGGMPINATWIDEAGEGETHDLGELWERISREIAASEGTILYARQEDFPLKGALIECGMTIGMGKPVAILLDCVRLEERSLRPLGSWAKHPLCKFVDHFGAAVSFIRAKAAGDQT